MKDINWKNLGRGLLLLLCYFLFMPLVASVLLKIFFPTLGNNLNAIYLNLIIYAAMVLLLLVIYRKTIFKEFRDYFKNFKRYFKIAFSSWAKAFLFMIITNSIIIMLAGNIANNEEANRSIIDIYPLFSFISMVLVGPFIEEMLFRKGFKDAFKNEQVFLLFTSFLFGFGHIIVSLDFTSFSSFLQCIPQLLFIIPYGGMGYFFGKAYYETDNIFTSTTTHMLHNTLAVCLSMIGV